MKHLLNLFVLLAVFITSFGEVAVVKNQLVPIKITFNQSFAENFKSEYSCPEGDASSGANCDSLKGFYQTCRSNGGEQIDCTRTTNDEAAKLDIVSAEEDFESKYGPVTADNVQTTAFIGVVITLIAEIISGIIRVSSGSTTVSAYIHLAASSLLLITLGVMALIFRNEIEDLMDKNKYIAGGNYSDKLDSFLSGGASNLSAAASEDEQFVEVQTKMLNDNIELLNKMATQNSTYATATGIAGGLMLTAAGFAVAEVFQCAASFGATGCTYVKPKKNNLFYAFLNYLFIKSLLPTAIAEDDGGAGVGSWIGNAIGTLSAGLLGSWAGSAATSTAQAFVKSGGPATAKAAQKAAEEAAKEAAKKGAKEGAKQTAEKASKEAAEKAASKMAPIIRVISFAISAANLFWTTHLFNKVSKTYSERATALEELKAGLQKTATESNVNSPGSSASASVTDMRSVTTSAQKGEDFTIGNCVDGNLNAKVPTGDPGCKTPKKAKFSLPRAKVGNISGFGSNGLSGNTSDVAKGLNDLANNGKGLNASFKDTGTTNKAVRDKAFDGLLKKSKELATNLTGDPKAFEKIVADQHKKNAALRSALEKSFPKSLFDKLNKSITGEPPAPEQKKPQQNQFARPKNQDDFDFSMPTATDQGFEEFGDEDGVHSGELAAVNDDFSDLESNAGDIIDNEGVSIFKVLEIRYKKSAYPRFFKRKNKQDVK